MFNWEIWPGLPVIYMFRTFAKLRCFWWYLELRNLHWYLELRNLHWDSNRNYAHVPRPVRNANCNRSCSPFVRLRKRKWWSFLSRSSGYTLVILKLFLLATVVEKQRQSFGMSRLNAVVFVTFYSFLCADFVRIKCSLLWKNYSTRSLDHIIVILARLLNYESRSLRSPTQLVWLQARANAWLIYCK